MRTNFIKMQALGNDYVFLDCLTMPLEQPEALARTVCKRRFSVGADGLVLLLPSAVADARMRIFNADGSEARMCGNAARCAARLLYESGYVKRSHVVLETDSGVRDIYLSVKNGAVEKISVDMGRAAVGDMFLFENAGEKFELREVSVGNKHQVALVCDVDYYDLSRLGPAFEKNLRFNDGVNTELCELIGENSLKVRTYERGCGETLACGTGACASAAAAIVNGLCSPERLIKISMRGGELGVICDADMRILLTGGATRVFEGKIDI